MRIFLRNEVNKWFFLGASIIFAFILGMLVTVYTQFNTAVATDMVDVLTMMGDQEVDLRAFADDLKYLKSRSDFNTLALFWLMFQLIFMGAVALATVFAAGYFKIFWRKHKGKKTTEERLTALENWRKYGGKKRE